MIKEDKKYANGHSGKGRPGWNAGLTKETNPGVAQQAQKMLGKPGWCKGETKETNPILMEVSKKNSVSIKKLWLDPDYARNQSESQKALWLDPVNGKRRRENIQALWADPDYAQGRGEILKSVWANYTEEEKSARVRVWAESQQIHPNKPESIILSILEQLYPNEYRFVGDGKVVIAGKIPDFININGQKKIIELFGDYWHEGERIPRTG
jgi:hypothetical protein